MEQNLRHLLCHEMGHIYAFFDIDKRLISWFSLEIKTAMALI